MRLSAKKNSKVQPRKRTNKNKHNKVKEVSKEEVVLNDIMDKEDKEAEIVLNDLVPERDKSKYGIKDKSNNNQKKSGIKLNFNLFPKNNKVNTSNNKSRNNKVIKNEELAKNKEYEKIEEETKVVDEIDNAQE